MTETVGAFAARQRDYFCCADAAKYRWQTSAALFAESERRLIAPAAGPGRLLEVGCGEGGNLFHLGPRVDVTVGVDLSLPKLAFAAHALRWVRFAGGDVTRLPFREGAFDRVVCRDVLHHVLPAAWPAVAMEMARVCRAGGEVVLIEPNGRNPLIAAFALLVPAERELLRLTPARVADLARSMGRVSRMETAQPFPLARLLLHYRFGWPRLAACPGVAALLGRLDAAAARIVPASRWAYVLVHVDRRPGECRMPPDRPEAAGVRA